MKGNGEALPNFATPEGALKCLEAAYIANDIEAAVKCKDFRIEARVMMSQLEQDLSGNEEFVARTAEVLELAFRNEMQSQGSPDFSNIDCRCVSTEPYEQFEDEDIVVVTEVCTFSDGGTSTQRILVARSDAGWRVLNPID